MPESGLLDPNSTGVERTLRDRGSMKCPNCGMEMPDNALYCEHCGKDIHIVPDFEPELEENMAQFIGDPLDDDEDEELTKAFFQHDSEEGEEGSNRKGRHGSRKKKYIWMIAAVCLLALAAAGAFAGVSAYRNNSYDYQVREAAEAAAAERYEEAIEYYERALELDASDPELYFSLADVQLRKGNRVEYEYLLRELTHNPLCGQEQLERAYGKLIDIYRERGEYDTIDALLKASENAAIQNAYKAYLVLPPEFSCEAGYYDTAVPLKLTPCAPGKVYYTLDGSDPDENSTLYTSPLVLMESVVVKAIFVNDYGVVSDVAEQEFFVDVDLDVGPEVSILSGDYDVPTRIEVWMEGDREAEIHYTTDGSDPTMNSQVYTRPLHMPLGDSVYKFAALKEDGTMGKITERAFHLELATEITPEIAVNLLVDKLLELQRISDRSGHYSQETKARYLYQYLYASRLQDLGDYYIVAEVLQDEEGLQSWTGTYYAVEVYGGTAYRLLVENGSYTLAEL